MKVKDISLKRLSELCEPVDEGAWKRKVGLDSLVFWFVDEGLEKSLKFGAVKGPGLESEELQCEDVEEEGLSSRNAVRSSDFDANAFAAVDMHRFPIVLEESFEDRIFCRCRI